MNRRKLHHNLRPIKLIPINLLIGLTILFIVVAVLSLRHNNLQAVKLREEVLIADRTNDDVDKALNELRQHVYAHMNTDLSTTTSVYPPIQLKYRYERLVAAEQDRASKVNEKIYRDAQKYCEKRNSTDFSGRNRVPCIQKYVSARGEEPKEIPDDLYKFDFTSPTWSPDLAGFSLLLAGFFALLTVARIIIEFWLKNKHI